MSAASNIHVELVPGYGDRRIYENTTCTGAQYDLRKIQYDLRKIREQIDPEWIPLRSVEIWVDGERALRWEYQTNDEIITAPRLLDQLSRSLLMEWERLKRACRCHIARRLAASLLHEIREDTEHGGVWTEEDLREEGLLPGSTKSRPGYWSRADLPLAKCLDLYDGAYGVGLIEHIPRYDTNNYHFVKYWLYDLEEVQPDG